MAPKRATYKLAEEAKKLFLSDPTEAERRFAKLLEQNPRDGVLYLKRAEARETIGELDLALSDFHKALALLTATRMKKAAHRAAHRIARLTRGLPTMPAIKRLPWIPDPSVALDCRLALEIAVKEPRTSLMLCRMTLEKVVDHILETRSVQSAPLADLTDKIIALKETGLIWGVPFSRMHTIRTLSEGAARGEPVLPVDALLAGSCLLSVLEEAFGSRAPREHPSAEELKALPPGAELAVLVFDSWLQSTSPGFRGPVLGKRQCLYKSEYVYVDVITEMCAETRRILVTGQALNLQRDEGIDNIRVTLQSGPQTLVETSTNLLGEFYLEFPEGKNMRLSVTLREDRTIIIPVRIP